MAVNNSRTSVCMATFNGGRWIKSQLDSILGQLSPDDEIVISDDGSTDNTIDIIKSYGDPRIRLYHNHFHNYILNFEAALSHASGDIIFLSDQDDVWKKGKVEIMKKALEISNLVCSNCDITDSSLNVKRPFFSTANGKTGFLNNLRHNHYLGCCLAFDKKILELALPFPKGLITHDTWLGMVAEAFGSTLFIDDRLMYYRRHGENTSSTTEGSSLCLWEKIKYRIVILTGIFRIYLRLLSK